MLTLTAFSILGVLLMLTGLTPFRRSSNWMAASGLVILGCLGIYEAAHPFDFIAQIPLNAMIHWTRTVAAFVALISFTGALVALMLPEAEVENGIPRAEMAALLVFSLTGAAVLVSFGHLVMLFLGVEILSIPLYVMAATRRRDLRGNEAALKYFLGGAFASGFLLFGIALLYAGTGTFHLGAIAQSVTQQVESSSVSNFVYAGTVLLLAGMAFKVAAAPFHFWAPDVYEGSPSPVTAYMATAVKTAAIFAFFRLFTGALGALPSWWGGLVAVVAAVSILGGNLTGLVQKSFKRMLAWSSIAHAGYLTLSLVAGQTASSALLLYTFAYTVASIPAFVILSALEKENAGEGFDAIQGLIRRNPLAGIGLSVSMLSLAGIPITAGFFGKWALFSAAVKAGFLPLVLVALVGSAISLGYYLHALIRASLDAPAGTKKLEFTGVQKGILVLCLALTLAVGFWPDLILKAI